MNMYQLKVTQIWDMRLNEYLRYWSLKALKSVSVTLYKLQMWSQMQSVQAMHKYMFHHLMTLFAVTLQAIHIWNIFRMQINIQIYAFNFDIHCKNAFCFLKIITHLYHFIAQMQSLCWDCIDFIDLYDTVLLQCYYLLKSLWRRECIICILTVFLHLLEWRHSEVLFS